MVIQVLGQGQGGFGFDGAVARTAWWVSSSEWRCPKISCHLGVDRGTAKGLVESINSRALRSQAAVSYSPVSQCIIFHLGSRDACPRYSRLLLNLTPLLVRNHLISSPRVSCPEKLLSL